MAGESVFGGILGDSANELTGALSGLVDVYANMQTTKLRNQIVKANIRNASLGMANFSSDPQATAGAPSGANPGIPVWALIGGAVLLYLVVAD